MKYINIFGIKIAQDKFKIHAFSILKAFGEILLSLVVGFSVWLILSL
jgi:hypothetical protein